MSQDDEKNEENPEDESYGLEKKNSHDREMKKSSVDSSKKSQRLKNHHKSKRKDMKRKSKRKGKKKRMNHLQGLEPTAAEKFEIFNEELYQAQQNHHFPFMDHPLSRQAYHLMKYKNFSFQNLLTLKSFVMDNCVPYVLTYSSILFKEDLNPSLFPAEIIQNEFNGREEKIEELENQIEILQNRLDNHLKEQTLLLENNLRKIEESLSRKETFEQKRAMEKKIYQNVKIKSQTCFVPILYANDIFTVIFEFLSLSSLSRLMRTCWLFHTLITDKVRVSVELPLNYFSKYPISDRLTYFQRIRKLHIVKDLNLPKDHLVHYDDPFDHTATITNKIHVVTQIIQIIHSNVNHIESLLLPDLSGKKKSRYPYFRGPRRDQRGRVKEKKESENLDQHTKKLDILIGQCTNLRMFQSPNFFPQPIPNSPSPRWNNLELVNCRFDSSTIKNIPQTVKILLLYPPRQAFDRWEWQQHERGMSVVEKRTLREKQLSELVEKKEVLEIVVMKLKNLRTLRLPMILFVRDDPRSGYFPRDDRGGMDDDDDVSGGDLNTVNTKKIEREKHQSKMTSLQEKLRISPEFVDFLVHSNLKSLNILTPAYYRVTEAPVYDTLMEGICQNIGTWKSIRSLKLTFLHYTMPLFFRFFSNLRNRHYKLLLFQVRNNEPMDYDFRYNLYRGPRPIEERKTSFERIDLEYYNFKHLNKKRVIIDKLMISITTLGFTELSKLEFLFGGVRVKYFRIGQMVPTEHVLKSFFFQLNNSKHRIEKLVILFQKWSINQFSSRGGLPMNGNLSDEEKDGEESDGEEEEEEEEKKRKKKEKRKDDDDMDEDLEGEKKKKKKQDVLWITVGRFFELLTEFIESNRKLKEIHIGRDFNRKEFRHYGPMRWSLFNDIEGVSEEVLVSFCSVVDKVKTVKKLYLPPLKRSILGKIKKVISRYEKLEKRIIVEECRKEKLRY